MAVPAGPYTEAYVRQLAQRLQDVASQLYDLDQSASLAVLDDVDKYEGRTREVLADVAHDRTWLWPAYTTARERVDLAVAAVERRAWDEARAAVVDPIDLTQVPPHDDLEEGIGLIADTARAVLEVALLVVPKIGEHLGALSEARSQLGTIEEQAALVGLSQAPELTTARRSVTEAYAAVSKDPLSVDPVAATNAVKLASEALAEASDELQRLPRRLGAGDGLLVEITVLIQQGRTALDEARAKIAQPAGLLMPLSSDVLTAGPQGLRPWLARLSRAAAEGDNKAALAGLRSWERAARGLRERAMEIVAANEAPVARRNELRGLVGALRAKAAASGLAEDVAAQALFDAAKAELSVAPCDLAKAETAVEACRAFLADR